MEEVKTKNPPWSRDEHILALNFYLKYAPNIPDKTSKEVSELSLVLNDLAKRSGVTKATNYRNTNGVYMKLMNFRRFDPNYTGVGLEHGSKDEDVVWSLYSGNRQELEKIASEIRSLTGTSKNILESLPPLSDEDEEANEGAVLSRLHLYRERNRELVKKKKKAFLQKHNSLFCEACGFDFQKVYGERGRDFIECHHTKPVSELTVDGVTRLSDLILLCSNCHRMVHRNRPWLNEESIKQLVK
jgi:5-methylcytosine-specific restriction protein A